MILYSRNSGSDEWNATQEFLHSKTSSTYGFVRETSYPYLCMHADLYTDMIAARLSVESKQYYYEYTDALRLIYPPENVHMTIRLLSSGLSQKAASNLVLFCLVGVMIRRAIC